MAEARWRNVLIGSAGVLAALTLVVVARGWLPGERALYDAIQGWASPTVVAVFRVVNLLGSKWILLPGTLLLLGMAALQERRRWWLWVGVMVGAPILEWVGKQVIGRPRPVGHSMGFPSGHATAAAAFFFLVAYLLGRRLRGRGIPPALLWAAASVVILLVGVARVVLRAHWPGDTLAGAALGLTCVSLAAWYHERSG